MGLRLIIEQPEFGQILVAREGTGVVGMVNLLFTLSAACDGPTVLLEDMVVHPSHRGMGIGSTLLRCAIALALSRGAAGIRLLTDRSNLTAIRFYQSHGFVSSVEEPMRLYVD